ncbi:MAG: hypothetical protein HYZ54_01240 [Ignavibacteriae bacterium]|nr:hypothetical protein [Ignavibacteriota bacterium]
MKLCFIIFLIVTITKSYSQQYKYVFKNAKDSTSNCYLTVLPASKEIKGVIIRDYSSLPDTSKKSPYKFNKLCSDSGLVVVYTVSSSFFPEFFYNDSTINLLDRMVSEVVQKYNIPRNAIFIGGISSSGTRALKYAQFCEQGRSKFGIKIKGVFAVDPPLDLERFYNSVKRHKHNFKAGMLWEAELMSKVFPEKMGGSPTDSPEKYLKVSVFSHSDSLGGNAKFLKNVNVILFHEPDIDWWIKERGSSYYDMNSYDIAALVVKMKELGSTTIDLITTTGKGFESNGNRNCHSWTIVNEKFLTNWILNKIE